jgi:hypothetical protein
MIKSAQALEMYQGSKEDEDYVMSKSASMGRPRAPPAAPTARAPGSAAAGCADVAPPLPQQCLT